MEKLNIQDIESDKVDDNDEAKSTTGTYTMDEDLETVSPPMNRTKYVEDWTAKHSHYSSQSSLSRRKLPPAPGNSSPESSSEGRDVSYDIEDVSHTNTNMKVKTS